MLIFLFLLLLFCFTSRARIIENDFGRGNLLVTRRERGRERLNERGITQTSRRINQDFSFIRNEATTAENKRPSKNNNRTDYYTKITTECSKLHATKLVETICIYVFYVFFYYLYNTKL